MAKTARQRRQEREERERVYWQKLVARLRAARTVSEVSAIAHDAPAPNQPGHQFHSNLIFALHGLQVPNASSHEERWLYLELFRQFVARGELKPESLKIYEDDLARSGYGGALPY